MMNRRFSEENIKIYDDKMSFIPEFVCVSFVALLSFPFWYIINISHIDCSMHSIWWAIC